MNILSHIKHIAVKSFTSFYRFPYAMTAATITTVIALYFLRFHTKEPVGIDLILAKLSIVSSLGFFLFTALRLLKKGVDTTTYRVILLSILVSLAAYFLSLPEISKMHLTNLEKHLFLTLLSFFSILWVPFLNKALDNKKYWAYAKRVIFAFFISGFFTFVLLTGINVAIFSIQVLFDYKISGEYIEMVNASIIGIFSTSYFLSQIPQEPSFSKDSTEDSLIEKFFTKYILTSLSVVYFLILYLYTTKVLISMEWPKGILSWLIVAFSFVAILTYLFWTPYTSKEGSRWRKLMWLGILLQSGMLFMAITMRINQYSWTENRYMVFIFGVWLVGISLYFLFYKKAKIKWIFISLSIILFISQIGGFSSYEVSKKAQTKRLATALKTYMRNKKKASYELKYNISSITAYLYNHYGIESLESIYPKITAEFKTLQEKEKKLRKEFKDNKERDALYKKLEALYGNRPQIFPNFATHELGFRFIYSWEYRNRDKLQGKPHILEYFTRNIQEKAESLGEYNFMINFINLESSSERKPIYIKNIGVTISLKQGILTIKRENDAIDIDIIAFAKKIAQKHHAIAFDLDPRELTLEKTNGSLKTKIQFMNLRIHFNKNKPHVMFLASLFFHIRHSSEK